MAKKAISSVELAALVNELQFLVDGKISQIYHPDKGELIIQYYARGKGKGLLRIIPGKFLNITKDKKSVLRPSGFCMQLRKYLNGAFIREIKQIDSERIMYFVLETAYYENNIRHVRIYNLVVEFFSKGNLLITDGDWEIIGTLGNQIWESRTIKAREKYELPPAGFNWKETSLEQLKEIITKSEKRNLATCLATELSLGGIFAEQICAKADVYPKKEIAEVQEKEIKALHESLHELVKSLSGTKGFIFSDESMSPVLLEGKEVNQMCETYNDALDTVDPFEKQSPYDQKIANAKKIIEQQKESIQLIEDKIKLNTEKGEKVYENYAQLQQLLDIVKKMRKSKEWQEIKTELKKESKIKGIDLKSKKITIDL